MLAEREHMGAMVARPPTNKTMHARRSEVRPHGFVAAATIHPRQEERFQVIAGTLSSRVAGVERNPYAVKPANPPLTS